MLDVAFDGLDGAKVDDIGRIDVNFTFEGKEVVLGKHHPSVPPFLEEFGALVKHSLLDLIGTNFAVNKAVVH